MSVLIFLIISYILLSISLYFLFKKTEVDPIKGLIPGVNFIEWCKLIGRKPLYALWLLFPIVNIFIFTGMAVDLVRSFGKLKFIDSALAVIYAPLAFFKTAFNEDDKYVGTTLVLEKEYAKKMQEAKDAGNDYEFKKLAENNPYAKSGAREWVESVVFAVFAAAFIRMFLIEAYIIPTPSMEGSLLVGDFLFVSKSAYGIRTPQTIAMIPLLHNTIPKVGTESYLKSPSLPYYRLPALSNVERNDAFVFNWPAGDSIYLTPQRSLSAFQVSQYPASTQANIKKYGLRVRPVDKRDHYIKRCLGIPGDSLQIIDNQVFVNGKPLENPTKMQFNYQVASNSLPKGKIKNLEKYEITASDFNANDPNEIALTPEQAEMIKEKFPETNITIAQHLRPNPYQHPDAVFPNDSKNFKWTIDNFGPIYIPKKGATVVITPNNIALYKRIIGTYEGHDLTIKNGTIFIDGQKATSYTFEQDYYWAMGDNRHSSEDSRFWGYVPHDHLVGKPIFVWMSIKDGNLFKGIRWNRLFKKANVL